MNQAIQFPEREWRDESLQAVCFSALMNGFQMVCAIDGEALLRRCTTTGDPLVCFCLNRLMLEEDAELGIKYHKEDAQGWV